MGYIFRLAARDLLYGPNLRQYMTYHGLCYTSCGAQGETAFKPDTNPVPNRVSPQTLTFMSSFSQKRMLENLFYSSISEGDELSAVLCSTNQTPPPPPPPPPGSVSTLFFFSQLIQIVDNPICHYSSLTAVNRAGHQSICSRVERKCVMVSVFVPLLRG